MSTPIAEAVVREFNLIKARALAALAELVDSEEDDPLTAERVEALEAIGRDLLANTLVVVGYQPGGPRTDALGPMSKLLETLAAGLSKRRTGVGLGKRLGDLIDRYLVRAEQAIQTAVMEPLDLREEVATPVSAPPYVHEVSGTGLHVVLAQADYMSGDMFGVSAALALYPATVGLAIFYQIDDEGHRKKTNELLKFYTACEFGERDRIAVIPTTNCRLAYKYATDGYFPPEVFPLGVPSVLSAVGMCSTIGTATRLVAEAYQRGASAARRALQAAWLPAGWKTGDVSFFKGGKTIAEWTAERLPKGPAYALLWFRSSGSAGGAHLELDTSELATAELIETLRAGGAIEDATIVLIGDGGHKLAKQADYNLTEFWKDPGSPFARGDRRVQLAFFAYLVEQGYNFMNIGMRSGALEGPALLGARTVYLEEIYNLQEGRMGQWEEVVPGYKRVELGHVPTKAGKVELGKLLARDVAAQGVLLRDECAGLAALAGIKPPEMHGFVYQVANNSPTPTTVEFNPLDTHTAFERICEKVQLKLNVKSLKTSMGSAAWDEFRWRLRSAIRAAHAHHKAQVKQRIGEAYGGPEEGLSEADKLKLWQAVGGTIDKWETPQRKERKTKENRK